MDPQQPTDRRPASAFVVFLVLMSGWFAVRTCQKANEPRPPPAETAPAATPGDAAPRGAAQDAPVDGSQPAPAAAEHLYPVTKGVARDDAIVVDTDTFRATFSNHGAVLVELLLKQYFRKPGDDKDAVKRADPANWLPLVAPHDPRALTFRLIHNGRAAGSSALQLDAAEWSVERRDAGGAPQLVFKLDDGDGRHFEKWFTFRPDGYFFDVELHFSSVRPDAAQGTASYGFVAAGGIWNEHNSKWAKPPAAVISAEDVDQVQLLDSAGLQDGPQARAIRREELAPFFGARSNFFGFVLSPDAASAGNVETVACSRVLDPWRFEEERARRLAGRVELSAEEAAALRDECFSNVRAEPFLKVPFPAGARPLALRFTAFAGPRGPEAMAAPEGEPFRVLYEVEYGSWTTFRWINQLLLGWMGLLERLTGNWGVAIILLTVTVKALLFPLNRMQSRSMEQFQKKMKLLQPQIEEIKKRHKNNPQKAGVEQQKLMREHGVRPPFFGCLVLFLQMPVWYGVFQIMSSAPSLRHQPFFGWISDLSAPDVVPLPFALPMIGTLHLLPILMLVAWLLQNRMMPKPVDPQQAQMQKMMNFFPFIFLFMLYGYASGQSLYMVTNSLLGMVQMKFLRVTPSN